MTVNKHGLGRGIDVLFRNGPATPVKEEVENSNSVLPLAVLKPCPYQPRRVFEDQPLQELAESIRSQGIVQPLLVRPIAGGTHYEIVAGERRYRAAKMAGLSTVPVVIRHMSDDEALTAALVENLQREDLNPLEEAEAMQALRDRLGESQEALAIRLGKSRSAVANALRLLQLPDDMRQALAGNLFTPGHARAVLAIAEEELQRQLYDAVVDRQLSVRDAESAVQHYKRTGQLPPALLADGETAKPAGPRGTKPELVRDIQRVLRETLGAKVTVSGSGDMGRVTIPYGSAEHLAELMRLLCAGQMQDSLDALSLPNSLSAADVETTSANETADAETATAAPMAVDAVPTDFDEKMPSSTPAPDESDADNTVADAPSEETLDVEELDADTLNAYVQHVKELDGDPLNADAQDIALRESDRFTS